MQQQVAGTSAVALSPADPKVNGVIPTPRLSHDQHAIAVREETVAGFDGVAICGQHQLPPGERACQYQKAGLRQVKVGEHRPGAPELEARRDEEVRLGTRRIAFDCPDAGGAHRHHSRGRIHRLDGFSRHYEALRMQPHIVDNFGMQRLEGAQSDVQRDPRDPGPLARHASRISGVKWSPAVGAATDPRSRAKTV